MTRLLDLICNFVFNVMTAVAGQRL